MSRFGESKRGGKLCCRSEDMRVTRSALIKVEFFCEQKSVSQKSIFSRMLNGLLRVPGISWRQISASSLSAKGGKGRQCTLARLPNANIEDLTILKHSYNGWHGRENWLVKKIPVKRGDSARGVRLQFHSVFNCRKKYFKQSQRASWNLSFVPRLNTKAAMAFSGSD
jgi:hypothetical protein